MDSPDQYAVKGHDLMRKAQKVLKGTSVLTQAPFSATSHPTSLNVLKKHSKFINKPPQTSSSPSFGTNPHAHI